MNTDPAYWSHQSFFVACYNSDFLHAILPMGDITIWVRNLIMFLALALTTGSDMVADFPGESLFWGDSLALCQEGDQLLLFCGEYDLEKILVLSLPNLTLQQEIGIENLDFYTTYQQEDFLALLSYNGDFIILEEAEGCYTQVLQGNYATHTDYSSGLLNWVTALDYQDGKLVTAFRNQHYTADHSSVFVSVNTTEGCIFTGLYTTSLQEETPLTSSIGNRVEQWGDMPLEITSAI